MKRADYLPLAFSAVCVIVTVLVAGGLIRIGVEGEWVWQRVRPASWLGALAGAVSGLALAVGVWWLSRAGRRRVAAVLVLLVVGGFILQFAVGAIGVADVGGAEAALVTVVPYIGGYFHQARNVEDGGRFIREYAEWMEPIQLDDRVLGHLGDHPAGLVVFYWGIIRTLEASPAAVGAVNSLASLVAPGGAELSLGLAGPELTEAELASVWLSAWLLRLAMAFAVVPFYALARRVCGREVALRCAVLFAFVPAFYLFSPSPDQLFVVVAVAAGLFATMAWQGKRVWPGVVAGLVLFVGLNLTLGLLVLIVFGVVAAVVSALGRYRAGERLGELSVRFAFAGGTGAGMILLLSALVWVALGYNSFEVWLLSLRKHSQFAGIFPRTYWKWVAVNPLEFWAFLGVSAGLMLIWSLLGRAREKGRGLVFEDVPLVGFFALMFLLNVSGKNLGEVGRLWMFLMPYAILAASGVVRRVGEGGVAIMAAAQVIQLVAFKLALDIFSIKQLLHY